jgi:hypothetical protein
MRQRNPQLVVLAAVFSVVLLGACGDSDEADSGDASTAGDSSLTVTLDPDGPDGPEEETTDEVSCEEGSEEAVCQAIAEIDVDALGPVSPDTACTELFGGPDTASLEGTMEGEEVDVDLTRANGCEIERFDAAVPLLQALYPDYEPGGSLAP